MEQHMRFSRSDRVQFTRKFGKVPKGAYATVLGYGHYDSLINVIIQGSQERVENVPVSYLKRAGSQGKQLKSFTMH